MRRARLLGAAAVIAAASTLAACSGAGVSPTASVRDVTGQSLGAVDVRREIPATLAGRHGDAQAALTRLTLTSQGRLSVVGTATTPRTAEGYAFAERQTTSAGITMNASDAQTTLVGSSGWGPRHEAAAGPQPASRDVSLRRRDRPGERVVTAAWLRDGRECAVVRVMSDVTMIGAGQRYYNGGLAAGCGAQGTSRADVLASIEAIARAALTTLDAAQAALNAAPTAGTASPGERGDV